MKERFQDIQLNGSLPSNIHPLMSEMIKKFLSPDGSAQIDFGPHPFAVPKTVWRPVAGEGEDFEAIFTGDESEHIFSVTKKDRLAGDTFLSLSWEKDWIYGPQVMLGDAFFQASFTSFEQVLFFRLTVPVEEASRTVSLRFSPSGRFVGLSRQTSATGGGGRGGGILQVEENLIEQEEGQSVFDWTNGGVTNRVAIPQVDLSLFSHQWRELNSQNWSSYQTRFHQFAQPLLQAVEPVRARIVYNFG